MRQDRERLCLACDTNSREQNKSAASELRPKWTPLNLIRP